MKWLVKAVLLLRFVIFYLGEVILSNLRVAHDVLTPTDYFTPAILAMPLDADTDLEILTVACLISMTPGTLSLDVSTDRKVLYVHAMYVEDEAALIADLKTNFEARVLRLLRS